MAASATPVDLWSWRAPLASVARGGLPTGIQSNASHRATFWPVPPSRVRAGPLPAPLSLAALAAAPLVRREASPSAAPWSPDPLLSVDGRSNEGFDTALWFRNVVPPLERALRLEFVDASASAPGVSGRPDLAVVHQAAVVAVGELKTAAKYRLADWEQYGALLPQMQRFVTFPTAAHELVRQYHAEHAEYVARGSPQGLHTFSCVSQVLGQMRDNQSDFGFLATAHFVVFLRLQPGGVVELSGPLRLDATDFLPRFAHFLVQACNRKQEQNADAALAPSVSGGGRALAASAPVPEPVVAACAGADAVDAAPPAGILPVVYSTPIAYPSIQASATAPSGGGGGGGGGDDTDDEEYEFAEPSGGSDEDDVEPVDKKRMARSGSSNNHRRSAKRGCTEEERREGVYPCQHCGRRFADGSTRLKHERLHVGDLPHVCDECGKRFAQSGSLTKHMRTHTNERPFRCSRCPRAFSDSSDLRRHERLHEPAAPPPRFVPRLPARQSEQ